MTKRYAVGVEFTLITDSPEEIEDIVMEALENASFDSVVIWDWAECNDD